MSLRNRLQQVPMITWILLAFAIVYFMGNQWIAMTDPVESNYSLTALEMLKTHDWFSPKIYGNYWYDKPIMFYWELILAFKLFGVNDFAARFFPAVISLVNLGMTYWFTKRVFDKKTALVATVILGSCLEYFVIAKAVITDASLFLFMNGALVCFYLAYSTAKKWLYYPMYVLAGLAVLTKGPVGFLLPGLIITLFYLTQRNWRELLKTKMLVGLPVFMLVGGSWYDYMYQIHGADFVMNFLGVHNVLRATVSEHPKDNVWYYYLMIFVIGTLPWAFTLPAWLREWWKNRKTFTLRNKPDRVFLLIWALTINVFFQLMATKYTTYTYPALLPIAILFALYLRDHLKVVKWMAIGSVIFYFGVGCLAGPVTQAYYSTKAVGQFIQNNVDDEAVILYNRSYRTSLSYYLDARPVLRLVPDHEVEGLKPNGMSWNAKNVMPIIGYSEIPQDKPVYLVNNNKDEVHAPGAWKAVYADERVTVYEKEKPESVTFQENVIVNP